MVADTGAVRLLQGELARAGIRPRSLTWGPLALSAAAQRLPLGDEELALVADIGVHGTDVVLVGAEQIARKRAME